jgi:hypothetical protein
MTVSDSNARAASGAGRSTPRVPLIASMYLAIIVLTSAGNWPLMKPALGAVPPLKFVLLRVAGSLPLAGRRFRAARP